MFINSPNRTSVKSATTTTPPGSPNTTDVYIVAAGATGAWSGQAGKFARWDGAAWQFLVPSEGVLVWAQDSPPKIYQSVGGSFVSYNSGAASSSLTVAEQDGTPSVANVTTIKFSNGSVTDDGAGVVSISTSGGISPPFADNSALVKSNADATKQVIFNASSLTTATTRTITIPDADTTLVGTALSQTLTNKTLGSSTSVTSSISWGAGVKQTFSPNATTSGLNIGSVSGDVSSPSNGDLWYDSSGHLFRARINGATVSLGAGGGSSLPFSDGSALISNSSDATKLARFSAASITTGTTRVYTLPDSTTTIVGTDVSQTLTNKTLGSGGVVSASLSWSSGVKQTFSPSATTSGLNVGSVAGDVSSPANGDVWYDSTGQLLRARVNGATISLGAGGGGGITGTGTTNRLAVWSGTSSMTTSAFREVSTRIMYNGSADPDTTYPRVGINGLPSGNGFSINWGNWNSTSFAVPFGITSSRDNGGSSMVAPTPLLVFGMSGVGGQSYGSNASIAMNRYSTADNTSNTRLVIQAGAGSADYPIDTMSFYSTGRVGINNGSTSTSGNDAKARIHINDQLTNSGSSFSTTNWNSQGLVPLLAVWDAQDATGLQTHPVAVLAKKGVAAGQEAQRVEFGVGRYESATNAPRTRFDIRLAHAVNESVGARVASFYSYGGLGLGLANTVTSSSNNADAVLQVGDTPDNNGSYSLSNWNSSGNRVQSFFRSPTNNGGSSIAAPEPALILGRVGVTSQAFSNYVEFKIARYENSSTNARTALTIAATHAGGDASGTDIVEFRSDKTTSFKGPYGSGRNTVSASGSYTLNFSVGNIVELTMSGNLTLTHSNTKAGHTYTIFLINGGTNTITWGSAFKFAGASAPVATSGTGKIDIFTFYSDGTNLYEISRVFDVR